MKRTKVERGEIKTKRTKAERSEINRRNGLRSKDCPRDTSKSRYNAVIHGMTAKSHTLPNEEPGFAERVADEWNGFYRPQDPGVQHMVDLCVEAKIMSGRARRFHTARLTKQVREADGDWAKQDQDRLAQHLELLKTDPAAAVRGLRDFASGCRWMIGRWEELDLVLDTKGNWCEVDRYDAIRLLGHRPEPDYLRWNPEAWHVRMLNLACHPAPGEAAIPFLFQEAVLPERYLVAYNEGRIPPPAEEARPVLRAMIADQLAELRQREEYLRVNIEGPDRAEAPERALILKDEKDARLFLRYYSESRSTFFRAYAALLKAIKGREEPSAASEEAGNGADPDPETPPIPAPAEAPEAVSRNEANPAVESDASVEESTTSGKPAAGRGRSGEGREGADSGASGACEGPHRADEADAGGETVPIGGLARAS
jgi:hypothetical protein